ncbi:MAG: glycosyltransferase family protein [Chitinophagaceae bacterium]
MRISGFTMVRNAEKYYFPIKEVILSVLPLVDEFIVALGDSDPDDHSRELILSIGSPKIKIIQRQWDESLFKDGKIFKVETDFALSHCSGDWCFYLQGDEVIHERDHEEIHQKCLQYLGDRRVEGFLFNYLHFWGDYRHILNFHGWYKNEIRIVRNHIGIQSFKDAQSFRTCKNSHLKVIPLNAQVFHYGWVRPPHLMQSKRKEQISIHFGKEKAHQTFQKTESRFDFGPLGRLPVYEGTHPEVMNTCIQQLAWSTDLNYGKKMVLQRPLIKHERWKYKLLSYFENRFLDGHQIFGYSNWSILPP